MNSAFPSIDRARAYVAAIPRAVSGADGSGATFAVACKLVKFGLSPDDAWRLLLEYNQRCQPQWSERELRHKLEDAFRRTSPRTDFVSRASHFRFDRKPKVKIDPANAIENFLKGFRCDDVDLWEVSPIRPPDDWTKDGACLVAMFYEADELINVVANYCLDAEGKARPADVGATLPRDEMIRRLTRGEFRSAAGGWLRMNPLDGRGIADANVTRFRFALVECDKLPLEMQLPLLAKLPLPIAAILTSGGRSLHAWVRVEADTLDEYRQTVSRMLALLAKFAVDTANKNPARMSRLPGVVRQIGADGDGRQRLLYLNPQPEQKAIL
jgi:hypothetical protein